VPVFWADAPIYILVAAIASIITFYAERTLSQPQLFKAILYIDGLGEPRSDLVPVFWADAPIYILVAAIASIITFYAERTLSQPQLFKAILYIDGLGAALFGIQGADKAWHYDFGGSAAAIILGVVTAIGGGLIRDVLAGRKTLLMSYELYAIPVSLGCMLYVLLLNYLPELAIPGSITCILVIFLFRSAAIYWNLKVPVMFISRKK